MALARADLVITGEGRIDEQTAFGKTALGVARRAQAAGKPCVAVGGGVTAGGIEALAAVGASVVACHERADQPRGGDAPRAPDRWQRRRSASPRPRRLT